MEEAVPSPLTGRLAEKSRGDNYEFQEVGGTLAVEKNETFCQSNLFPMHLNRRSIEHNIKTYQHDVIICHPFLVRVCERACAYRQPRPGPGCMSCLLALLCPNPQAHYHPSSYIIQQFRLNSFPNEECYESAAPISRPFRGLIPFAPAN